MLLIGIIVVSGCVGVAIGTLITYGIIIHKNKK